MELSRDYSDQNRWTIPFFNKKRWPLTTSESLFIVYCEPNPFFTSINPPLIGVDVETCTMFLPDWLGYEEPASLLYNAMGNPAELGKLAVCP